MQNDIDAEFKTAALHLSQEDIKLQDIETNETVSTMNSNEFEIDEQVKFTDQNQTFSTEPMVEHTKTSLNSNSIAKTQIENEIINEVITAENIKTNLSSNEKAQTSNRLENKPDINEIKIQTDVNSNLNSIKLNHPTTSNSSSPSYNLVERETVEPEFSVEYPNKNTSSENIIQNNTILLDQCVKTPEAKNIIQNNILNLNLKNNLQENIQPEQAIDNEINNNKKKNTIKEFENKNKRSSLIKSNTINNSCNFKQDQAKFNQTGFHEVHYSEQLTKTLTLDELTKIKNKSEISVDSAISLYTTLPESENTSKNTTILEQTELDRSIDLSLSQSLTPTIEKEVDSGESSSTEIESQAPPDEFSENSDGLKSFNNSLRIGLKNINGP